MNALEKVPLYLCYIGIALFGLHYHAATPFFHLACFLSIVYLAITAFTQPAKKWALTKVDIFWLSTLVLWPTSYFLVSVFSPDSPAFKTFLNLLKSMTLFIPIYLVTLHVEIKKEHLSLSILASLAGATITAFYNYYTERTTEDIYLSSGSINLSIIFAAIIAMLMSCTYIIAIDYHQHKKIFLSRLCYFVLILSGGALILTGSRGAMAALIIPTVIFLMHLFKLIKNKIHFSLYSMTFMLMSAPFIMASPLYLKAVNKFTDFSLLGILGERYHVWLAGLEALKTHYLFGLGVGQDNQVISAYINRNNLPEEYASIGHMHNDVLQTFFTFGVPVGLLLILTAYYPGIWALIKYKKNIKNTLFIMPTLILLSFFISGLTDVVTLQAPSMKMYCLLIFLSLIYIRQNQFKHEQALR